MVWPYTYPRLAKKKKKTKIEVHVHVPGKYFRNSFISDKFEIKKPLIFIEWTILESGIDSIYAKPKRESPGDTLVIYRRILQAEFHTLVLHLHVPRLKIETNLNAH